jgi:hypothetical protein
LIIAVEMQSPKMPFEIEIEDGTISPVSCPPSLSLSVVRWSTFFWAFQNC